MSDISDYLATVKVGDVVFTESGVELSVTRITRTQICCGSSRFRNTDGLRIGDTSRRWNLNLVTPARAEETRVWKDRERVIGAWKSPLARTYTQARVLAERALCDEIEAMLRSAGVWTDEEGRK